jgi:hypothetical protein
METMQKQIEEFVHTLNSELANRSTAGPDAERMSLIPFKRKS